MRDKPKEMDSVGSSEGEYERERFAGDAVRFRFLSDVGIGVGRTDDVGRTVDGIGVQYAAKQAASDKATTTFILAKEERDDKHCVAPHERMVLRRCKKILASSSLPTAASN